MKTRTINVINYGHFNHKCSKYRKSYEFEYISLFMARVMFQKLKLLHQQFHWWLTIILLTNQELHYFILCSVTLMIAKDWHHGGSSLRHLGYLMFDIPSVFHRAKTLSTVVTKQVSYQIFICILRLRVTSPRVGIRLWGTEGRLCLPCHIHSNTSSTFLLNKTNNCYLFSVLKSLFFQTPCHQFYRKEPII